MTHRRWTVQLSDFAQGDYDEILRWTARRFGIATLLAAHVGAQGRAEEPAPYNNQHGVALTTAAALTVRKRIRLIGELLAADSNLQQRVLVGKPPQLAEIQAQLALRLTF